MCQKILVCITVLMLGLAGNVSPVLAGDWTNGAGDGDWMNPGNWSNGLPTGNERVDIESTSDMVWPTLSDAVAECGQLRLAYDATTVGELTVTGGATLNIGGELRFGRKPSDPATTGKLMMSGDNTQVSVSDIIECGRYGNGIIEMEGGHFIAQDELRLGYRDESSGQVLLAGGILDLRADPGLTVGSGADDVGTVTALIDISGGGTLLLAGDQVSLVETLINDGTIIGHGGTRPVEFMYDGDNTVVTSVNPAKAADPVPGNHDLDIPRDTVLTWQVAEDVPPTGGHKIFLSENMSEVAEGLGGMIQDTNEYVPDQLLEYGATYYWRVDEASATGSWHQGDVWSFQIEPFSRPIPSDLMTAIADSNAFLQGPENTINSSGLEDELHSHDNLDMWLSDTSEPNEAWVQYSFDKAYKLDEMLVWNHNAQSENIVGWGIKNALIEYSVDGNQWIALDAVELARATVTPVDAVDLQGIVAKCVKITAQSNWGGLFPQYGLSEVRFMSIPTYARLPQPVSGQGDVSPDVILTWRAGRDAASHNVYVGSDPNVLEFAESVNESSFNTIPLDLKLGQTYYWRVDEVNEAETSSVWQGDVLEFSMVESKTVDDFERYGNDPNTYSRVFQTWIDGFGFTAPAPGNSGNATGAAAGHDIWNTMSPHYGGSIIEKDIFHGRRGQSAPIYYGVGNKTLSEVTRTFETAQSWTRSGVKALVLYFYGAADNAPAQLYVKINNTRVDFEGDMETLQRVSWQKWYIPLTDLSHSLLAEVKSLTLGIEGSGSGVFYVDDISLTADNRTVITPIAPTFDNLVSHYAFDGDAFDSTGVHPGTTMGLSTFEPGKIGQAVSFAGLFGDYVKISGYNGILGSGEITITAWIKTSATDTGTIISWGPATPDGGRFGFRVNENRIRSEFSGGNVQGASAVNDGGWHHVAVTVQANATISYPAVTLYVDGQDDTLSTEDDTLIDILDDSDKVVRIGCRASAEDRWFGGLIDDLRIYDRVLSAAEIAGAAGRVAPFDR